jgi:hypothetical protein
MRISRMKTDATIIKGIRIVLIGTLLLLGACAKSTGPGAGDEAKKGWDGARSAEQLDHLRDRAVLVQTDR